MPTVQDILKVKGSTVHSIDHHATVLAAAQAMNDKRIGALVVTRQDKVVGIFTERDILNRVVAKQLDPVATKVNDVMTAPIACCTGETTRAECRAVMKNRRIRHLPVVENDKLLGIISIGDLLEVEGAEQRETIRHLYEYMNVDWGEHHEGSANTNG